MTARYVAKNNQYRTCRDKKRTKKSDHFACHGIALFLRPVVMPCRPRWCRAWQPEMIRGVCGRGTMHRTREHGRVFSLTAATATDTTTTGAAELGCVIYYVCRTVTVRQRPGQTIVRAPRAVGRRTGTQADGRQGAAAPHVAYAAAAVVLVSIDAPTSLHDGACPTIPCTRMHASCYAYTHADVCPYRHCMHMHMDARCTGSPVGWIHPSRSGPCTSMTLQHGGMYRLLLLASKAPSRTMARVHARFSGEAVYCVAQSSREGTNCLGRGAITRTARDCGRSMERSRRSSLRAHTMCLGVHGWKVEGAEAEVDVSPALPRTSIITQSPAR
jgi:hypothetical protein